MLVRLQSGVHRNKRLLRYLTMSFDKKAWRRGYDRRWVLAKRQRCFDYLGGSCCWCNSTQDLQFDHIDRTVKHFTISGNLNRRWEVLKAELDKYQLLCIICHRAKTKACGETGGGHNKATKCPHGSISGYVAPWRCRCDLCRKAKANYRKKWQLSKIQLTEFSSSTPTAIILGPGPTCTS